MPILVENVVKLFLSDALLSAMSVEPLKEFQMKKHNWSEEQWEEYRSVVNQYIDKVHVNEKVEWDDMYEIANNTDGRQYFRASEMAWLEKRYTLLKKEILQHW